MMDKLRAKLKYVEEYLKISYCNESKTGRKKHLREKPREREERLRKKMKEFEQMRETELAKLAMKK